MPDRIRAVMEEYVESGSVPGLAWWVSRDGEVSRGELGTSRPTGSAMRSGRTRCSGCRRRRNR